MVVDFDKNGKYFNKGFPTCKPQKLVNLRTAQAKKKCKDALIGKGSTKAIVDFPDQAPFTAKGPLLIFNGPNKGKTKQIIFHVFANVPAPTAFVVPATLKPLKGGKYGTELSTHIPTISGGNGTLTDFQATVGKTYTVKSKKKHGRKHHKHGRRHGHKHGRKSLKHAKKKKYSILSARCANGRFVARFDVTWRDHSRLQGGITRPCKQK